MSTFVLMYFCTFVLFVLLYFVIWLDCPYELPCKIWSLQLKKFLSYEYFCTYVLFCTFVLFLFGNGCGRSRSTCMRNFGLLARKMAELLDQVRKRTLTTTTSIITITISSSDYTVQTQAKALKYLSLDKKIQETLFEIQFGFVFKSIKSHN